MDENSKKEVVKDEKGSADIMVEDSATAKKKPKKQAKMSSFMVAKKEEKVEIIDDDVKKLNPSSSPKIEIPLGTVKIEEVVFLLPDKRFNGEGRWVQIETPDFYFINTYVPNSGQNLERLDYRVDEW